MNTNNRHRNLRKFNVFLFISTFARSLIEIFISLFLFKNGFSIHDILVFYILENVFAIFISYFFVKIGEKYKYSTVMYIGIVSFVLLQFVLNNIDHSMAYIILVAFLYSMYRRGYWVSRRFYATSIVPQKNSSSSFSLMIAISELASILSGFVGGFLLDGFDTVVMTTISSILLVISVAPLFGLKQDARNNKIELLKNLKKYDKRNYLAFTLYEINNLLSFIFPIYIALYVKDTYMLAGSINAISNVAIILFVVLYGKLLKKRNFFIISTLLFIGVSFAKLFFLNYFVLAIYFIEGMIKKMQEQSVSKIYFENRKDMDLTHYNLIYQLIESVARALVAVSLLFMNDIRMMIPFILAVISVELLAYTFTKKDKHLR